MLADPLRTVLEKLQGHRRASADQYEAKCPAHDDNRASLSVGVGGSGRVLVRCHAGCDFRDILRELELGPSDLYPAPEATRRQVAAYPYKDEQGRLLYEVVRFEPKDFRQRCPDGKGGWTWSVKGVRRVPYRLSELMSASATGQDVWIVEGEKDVETLRRAGVAATTNPGGAGKWRPEYADAFMGCRCAYVIPDADSIGLEHASDVVASLSSKVPIVKVVKLPRGFKDVSEWLSGGATIQRLHELGASAEPLPPVAASSSSASTTKTVIGLEARSPNETDPFHAVVVPVPRLELGTENQFPEPSGTGGTIMFEALGDFLERARTAPAPSWLVDGLIPSSGKVLLVAAPNAGKTWLALIAIKSAAAEGRACFLVEEEGGLRPLADRIRKLGMHEFGDIYVAHLRSVSLDDDPTLRAFEKKLAAADAPVLVLDLLNALSGGDENDTHAATKLRQRFDRLAAANPRVRESGQLGFYGMG